MKVIPLIAQKGGANKTTLAINLCVAALQDDKEAMIIDLDPQASAAKWRDLRKNERTPVVISAQASRLQENLERARAASADLVFIDTAPHSDNTALIAARSADLILIPTKTGILDLQTVADSLDIAKLANKPTAIILTAVQARGTSAEEARQALERLGVEISPYPTGYRVAYINAPSRGLAVQEYEPHGKAAEEITALYQWVLNKVSE
jgi:chromosome partitioning protein